MLFTPEQIADAAVKAQAEVHAAELETLTDRLMERADENGKISSDQMSAFILGESHRFTIEFTKALLRILSESSQ